MRLAALPRPHTARAYLDWLASQPCLCCGVRPVVLHHLHVWGLPRKRNNPLRDYVTVPVCDNHHRDTGHPQAAHRMQQDAWLAHWGQQSADALLLGFYARYSAHAGLPLPQGLDAREAARWLRDREVA